MLGWMIMFALMAMLGAILTISNPASVSGLVSAMFLILFFLGLLTRLVRGRAW